MRPRIKCLGRREEHGMTDTRCQDVEPTVEHHRRRPQSAVFPATATRTASNKMFRSSRSCRKVYAEMLDLQQLCSENQPRPLTREDVARLGTSGERRTKHGRLLPGTALPKIAGTRAQANSIGTSGFPPVPAVTLWLVSLFLLPPLRSSTPRHRHPTKVWLVLRSQIYI